MKFLNSLQMLQISGGMQDLMHASNWHYEGPSDLEKIEFKRLGIPYLKCWTHVSGGFQHCFWSA